jgi:acetylornithine/succinyldiaminopimelate/putrescine aminotransferase
VKPDAVAWAKGIAGGFPLGAIWFSKERLVHQQDGTTLPLCDLLGPGSHGTTFGGGPLGCRIALTVLETIDAGLLDSVKAQGARLKQGLEEIGSCGFSSTHFSSSHWMSSHKIFSRDL